MFQVVKNSWALLLGMLLLMIGNGLQGTLLGVRGGLESIDSATLGYVMSAYFVGFLIGSQITPILLRRVGHVRVFAALGSLVSAAFILYGALVHPAAWIFLRLIVGLCFSGLYVVAESWLNHSATNETRGQAMSTYMIVQMLGMALGQLLLNAGDPADYDLFVLLTVLVSVSFAPILLSSTPAPVYETSKPMNVRSLVVASPLASVSMFLLGGIYSILFAMAPVYAVSEGFSVANVSVFVTMVVLGGLVFQFPIGWLSDRMDRRQLIIGLTATGAFAGILGALFGNTYFVLLLIALILGGTSTPLYSLIVAYANDYLEPEHMSAASGGLLFLNGSGAMGGPILAGYLMSRFGNHWFFVIISTLMLAVCVYGLYRMTQRNTGNVDDQGPMMSISVRSTAVMTAVAAEMAIEQAEESALEAEEEAEEIYERKDLGDDEIDGTEENAK
jgi:MFS family permease